MQLEQVKNVYFIGIGGIGMSALARWFHANKYLVAGYDKTSTELTEALVKEGIHVTFEDSLKNCMKFCLVSYSSVKLYKAVYVGCRIV